MSKARGWEVLTETSVQASGNTMAGPLLGVWEEWTRHIRPGLQGSVGDGDTEHGTSSRSVLSFASPSQPRTRCPSKAKGQAEAQTPEDLEEHSSQTNAKVRRSIQ